jgi:hypothetical protein
MNISSALTVAQEPMLLPCTQACPGSSLPSHAGSFPPQSHTPSHPPRGRLLFLDPARRQASLKAMGSPGAPRHGPQGELSGSLAPAEPFKEALHLYAGRSQAKTLLGGLAPQERPRVAITQWGNLPLYGHFLQDIGLAGWVEALAITRRSDAIPALNLIQLGHYRLLLGYRYVDNLKYPLRDPGFLEVVGLETPIHPKTYANFMATLPPETLRQLHQRAVLKSNELGCDDGQGLYALDLSPLEVYGDYFEGATRMRPKDGHPTTGFQVAALLRLGRHPTVVAIGIYPGNTDELDVVVPLIEEAQALLGPEAIRLLLLDRGFSSGEMLYQLKTTYGIDWIIPAKDAAYVDRAIKSVTETDWQPTSDKGLTIASRVVTDVPNCPLEATLILLAHAPKRPAPEPSAPQSRQEKLVAIPSKHLKAFLRLEGLKVSGAKRVLVERILQEAHPGKVDLIISLFFKPPRKKVVEDQHVQGYLSSLQVEAEHLQATILTHRQRWDIENRLFRVCKEDFGLEYLPVSKWEATQNHIALLALTFNLWVLFKKRMGEPLEKASPQRLRQEFLQSFQLFVRAGEHTGIVGIELLMALYWEQEKQLHDLVLRLRRLQVEPAQDVSFDTGAAM